MVIILGLVLVISTFFDVIYSSIFLYTFAGRSSVYSLAYFIAIWAINLVTQFVLIVSIVRRVSSNKQLKTRLFRLMNPLMLGSIVTIASTFLLLVFQMFSTSTYDLLVFNFLIVFDLITSIVIIIILLVKFSFWFRRKKNYIIAIYFIGFSLFLLTLVSAMIALMEELADRPSPISPYPNPWDRFSTRNPVFYDVYQNSSLISFALIWLGTSILLRNYMTNYSKTIRKGTFWILASLPLIYYVGSLNFVLSSLNSTFFEFSYISNLLDYLLGGVKQIGGFFFCLSFIFMSKNVENKILSNSLLLAGVGIMTLYSSIQITILHIIPYPPFGLSTISVLPLSSYIVLMGLYYSARSISFDRELLRRLEKQIKNAPESFLNAIGSSEWNSNLEVTINDILGKVKVDEDITSELSIDDMRNHISVVLDELEKKRTE